MLSCCCGPSFHINSKSYGHFHALILLRFAFGVRETTHTHVDSPDDPLRVSNQSGLDMVLVCVMM